MHSFHISIVHVHIVALSTLIAGAPSGNLDALGDVAMPHTQHLRAESEQGYAKDNQICYQNDDCTPGGCCVWPSASTTSSPSSSASEKTSSSKPTQAKREIQLNEELNLADSADSVEQMRQSPGPEARLSTRFEGDQSGTVRASWGGRAERHSRPHGTCAVLATDKMPCSVRTTKNQGLGPGESGYVGACPCNSPYLICVPLTYQPIGDYHCELHG